MLINGTSCVGREISRRNKPEKDAKIRAFCQGGGCVNEAEDEVKRAPKQPAAEQAIIIAGLPDQIGRKIDGGFCVFLLNIRKLFPVKEPSTRKSYLVSRYGSIQEKDQIYFIIFNSTSTAGRACANGNGSNISTAIEQGAIKSFDRGRGV